MIKVVFLIRSLDPGGTERQLATVIPRLSKDRFEVTVISFYRGGEFGAELAARDVEVLSLNKRGRWDLRVLWRLVRELKKLRPAILHSYLVEPNLVAIFIRPWLRSTRVIWGIRASDVDLSKQDWFARMNFRLQSFFSRFADLAIFNSNAGRDFHFAVGFRPRNSIVIHSGVDTDLFKPDAELGKIARQEWGVTDGTVLVGLVGRLDPMKGHPTFLRAAALVAREMTACRFVCVGAGPDAYATRLRRLAEELGLSDRLIWAGSRSDMPAIYNAMDVVCSSSTTEGLPNAIAEAMACGVRCVVTNVGDSVLLVGDTGVAVPSNDPKALADGLTRLIDDPGVRGGPDPRQQIVNKFGIQRLVERTEAALASLVQS
jgi:glycosyltransferase involved in cell wall biosynthesis